MTRKVTVTLNATADITGKFDDEFDITLMASKMMVVF